LRKKIKHTISLIDANKLNINLTEVKKKYINEISTRIEDFSNARDSLKNMENSLKILELIDDKHPSYKELPLFKSGKVTIAIYTNDGIIKYSEKSWGLVELKKKGIILSTPLDHLDTSKISFNIIPNVQKRFFELTFTDYKSKQ